MTTTEVPVRPFSVSPNAIAREVRRMGVLIRQAVPEALHLVVVLDGAAVFAADLMRAIYGDVSVEYLRASSYGLKPRSSGRVRLECVGRDSLAGKTVVVVDDIVDTGRTVAAVRDRLAVRHPARVLTACLLHRPSALTVGPAPDFVAFEVPERGFVAGYGMNFGHYGRNWPGIKEVL